MSNLRQQIKRATPRQLRPYLGALRRKALANPVRVRLQKRRLLKSSNLTANQQRLLQKVSDTIHHNDSMYGGDGENYFMAGLDAVDSIDRVLGGTPLVNIRSVLDMPCGYGRELRFLVQRFPQASITACDIQPGAADFCAKEFGAVATYSKPDLREMSFDQSFDLIWCGSLVTHLDSQSILDLLQLLSRHLNYGGVLIFTTHGDYVFNRIRTKETTYELSDSGADELVNSYLKNGYAYQDYPRGLGYFDFHPSGRGYGVSLTSPDFIRSLSDQVAGLLKIRFEERGWCDHQDLFAFVKRTREEVASDKE